MIIDIRIGRVIARKNKEEYAIKDMTKRIAAAAVCILSLALPQLTAAHPGNVAADGCHYCRTNCNKWKVPWNKRHCHAVKKVPIRSTKSQ